MLFNVALSSWESTAFHPQPFFTEMLFKMGANFF